MGARNLKTRGTNQRAKQRHTLVHNRRRLGEAIAQVGESKAIRMLMRYGCSRIEAQEIVHKSCAEGA